MASDEQCFFYEILSNFDLKNMITTYAKDFPWKKWPNLIRFQKKKFSNPQIFIVPIGIQKYRRIMIFLYFHI